MLEQDWVRETGEVSEMSGVKVQIKVYEEKIKSEGREKNEY